MKFHIPLKEFSSLIGKIQSVVPTKPAVAILSNVLLKAEKDLLIIQATDLTVSIQASAKAQVDEEGSIALPARRLFQLVRELITPQITFSVSEEKGAVLQAGSSNFKLQAVDAGVFPAFPDFSQGPSCTMKGGDLQKMLARTAIASAKDDSRQVLNSVMVQRASDLATFTGTDGKRLARNQLQITQDTEDSSESILPIKAVEEIIKVIDDKEEEVILYWLDQKLCVESGSTLLITKLFSGQYPDVSKVIPQKQDNPITLHKEELTALLRQVALFTSEESSSVRFTFEEGILHLNAASSEFGEGSVSMPVNYQGPKLQIAFNPHYFLDFLRHCNDETILFQVSSPYDPGLITDSSKGEFVIMPMRLEGVS